MGAWQPLPDDLPPEVRHFVEQLRLLKDRTGLSLVALGARTAYSKSSWQRYLNATQPPPRQAVAALCRVAGIPAEEAERFGVRWELAVQAWPRQPAPAPAPAGGGPLPVPADGPVPPPSGSTPGPADGPSLPPADAPVPGEYEDDPTVPWWDRPEEVPPQRPAGRRLLIAALLALLTLLVVALVGAVTLG
ncbi:helix-turn-helix domain-containing protein [Streptomyces glomeratus]|uniref:Transcriptional regulator n=1 Tax=Streptomyces glomeratus TaxID=284452 RepID=A0ABP6L622_9ACTN|nr:helix-turn-helix transcriptional regulator [Streptomyces glomeratus]MCF1507296.1 helix-turn-helix domain-containing protein [Streptomyces glomeratus]